LLINAVALWVAVSFIPGISFSGNPVLLLVVALVFGVVNAIVKPIVVILTLPFTLVTLGLFLLVINAAMLGLVSALLPSMGIDGFWPAFWTAIIVSVVSWVGAVIFKPNGKNN
jgi:putative membrane protein